MSGYMVQYTKTFTSGLLVGLTVDAGFTMPTLRSACDAANELNARAPEGRDMFTRAEYVRSVAQVVKVEGVEA